MKDQNREDLGALPQTPADLEGAALKLPQGDFIPLTLIVQERFSLLQGAEINILAQ